MQESLRGNPHPRHSKMEFNSEMNPYLRIGHVVTWGWSDDGRLGRGDDLSSGPAALDEFTRRADEWGAPIQLSCGSRHSAVVTGQ